MLDAVSVYLVLVDTQVQESDSGRKNGLGTSLEVAEVIHQQKHAFPKLHSKARLQTQTESHQNPPGSSSSEIPHR